MDDNLIKALKSVKDNTLIKVRGKKYSSEFILLKNNMYARRTISATDIVRIYCEGKTVVLQDGTKIKIDTDKKLNSIFISAHGTTLLYEDYMGEKDFILEVIEEDEEV